MSLLAAGYWPTTYWAENYWNNLYWPNYIIGEDGEVLEFSSLLKLIMFNKSIIINKIEKDAKIIIEINRVSLLE